MRQSDMACVISFQFPFSISEWSPIMNCRFYAIAFLFIVSFDSAPVIAATKVFILAGQSNMEGVGVASELPAIYGGVQSDVKIWNNVWSAPDTGTWSSLKPSAWTNADTGVTYFGPEVTFGYQIANRLLPNDQIYLIKYAAGSTSLYKDWKPGSGWCYTNLKTAVTSAMKNLTTANLSPSIAGMIWMQGETDAAYGGDYARDYAANLTSLITTARKDFGSPEMPVVLGRITESPMWASADIGLVRAAQTTVPNEVGYASWINTDDLDAYTSTSPYFGHFTTRGQMDLGVRFANEIVHVPEPSSLPLTCVASLTWLLYLCVHKRFIVP
jgi:hypothetical protein